MRAVRSNIDVRERARALRRRETPVEQMLWAALRDRRFRGLKFRRQHALGPFVADFYCPAYHMVIEVDGALHDAPDARVHDMARDACLRAHDVQVYRIPAHRVLHDFYAILADIEAVLEAQRLLGGSVEP
jgi:very-short-patch-repair endonuclease